MKAILLKVTFLVIIYSLVCSPVQAQEKQEAPKPNAAVQQKKMPTTQAARAPMKNMGGPALFGANSKVPVPVQNLMKFMGRWKGDVTLTTGGKTNKVQFNLIGRGTAGNNGIYIDEFYNDSILGDMKGANLVGFDPNDAKIHWFSVDNQGTTHEHTGNWASPDTLLLEHSSIRKAGSYKEKISLIFKGKEELQFSFFATLDGKESEKASGVFMREKPPVRPKVTPPANDVKKE